MFNIRFYTPEDALSILEITDEQLGRNYITTAELKNMQVLVAEDSKNRQCLGVCLFYVDSDNYGVVKTVATAVQQQGKGIATAMIAKAVEVLEGLHVAKVISPLWKHGSTINSDSVFRKNGFMPVLEIPNYWFEDSKSKAYSCPVCGFPCKCSCVIYEKILRNA